MCSYFHSLGIKIILKFYVGLVTDEGQPASFWSVLQEVQEGLQVIDQIQHDIIRLAFMHFLLFR